MQRLGRISGARWRSRMWSAAVGLLAVACALLTAFAPTPANASFAKRYDLAFTAVYPSYPSNPCLACHLTGTLLGGQPPLDTAYGVAFGSAASQAQAQAIIGGAALKNTVPGANGASFDFTILQGLNPNLAPNLPGVGTIVLNNRSATVGNPLILDVGTTGGASGSPTSVTNLSASLGTVSAAGTSITYTPTSAGSGSVSFQLVNGTGTSVQITFTPITVTLPLPIPVDQPNLATAFNTPKTFDASLGNLGGAATGASVIGVTNGTATVNGTMITFTPTALFSGTATVTFKLSNATGTSANQAVATINVLPQGVPVAADIAVSTPFNIPVSFNAATGAIGGVAANANLISVTNGTATVNGTNITFTPTAGFRGNATVVFTLSNQLGTSNQATATIAVAPPPPIAANQTVATSAGRAVSFDAAAGATGGPATGVSVISPGDGTTTVSGTTITFTPRAGFIGTTTVTFTLSNAGGGSNQASARITVSAANAAPPVAADQAVTTSAGGQVRINAAQGASNNPTSTAIVTQPRGGTATANGLTITYTANATFSGSDQFTYTLTNSFGTSAPATISVTVAARLVPTADRAVAAMMRQQSISTVQMANLQIGNFGQRLESLRGGASGFSAEGLRIGFGGQSLSLGMFPTGSRRSLPAPGEPDPYGTPIRTASNIPGSVIGEILGQNDRVFARWAPEPWSDRGSGETRLPAKLPDDDPMLRRDNPTRLPDGIGVFVNGNLSFGDANRNSAQSGFKFVSAGISGGMDYRFNREFLFGIGLGFSQTDSEIDGGGRDTDRAFNLAIYGSWVPAAQSYFDMVVSYGTLMLDSQRIAAFSGQTAFGQRKGRELLGSVTGGYVFKLDNLRLEPYARAQGARIDLDTFSETGAGIANLTFGDATTESLSTALALKLSYVYETENANVMPYARAELQHEFVGNTGGGLVRFADDPTSTMFTIPGLNTNRNVVNVGGGIRVGLSSQMSLFLDYRTVLHQSNLNQQSVLLGLSKRF